MSDRSPSRIGIWLLGRVAPERDRESIAGDLAEEYALRLRSGTQAAASVWYWGQVSRSIPPLVRRRLSDGRWIVTVAVALAAYVAAGFLEFAATAGLYAFAAPDTFAGAILGLIIGLGTLALAGNVAARIRPRASSALAAIVLIAVAMMMVMREDTVPFWYQIAFLTVGPVAALAGGGLGRKRRPRAGRRSAISPLFLLLLAGSMASCAAPARQGEQSVDRLVDQLVALERSALDRWITLDPDGYLGLFAPEVTYFDPTADTRLDGLEAMRARLAPIKNMKPPFSDPRYEMNGTKVQRHGDVAILTFNLINYGKLPDRQERVLARWNSTEVYRQIDGQWRIIHSHWSFTKPEIKPPGT